MIYIKEKTRRDVQSTFEETKYIVTNNRIKFCKPKKKDKKRILKYAISLPFIFKSSKSITRPINKYLTHNTNRQN